MNNIVLFLVYYNYDVFFICFVVVENVDRKLVFKVFCGILGFEIISNLI